VRLRRARPRAVAAAQDERRAAAAGYFAGSDGPWGQSPDDAYPITRGEALSVPAIAAAFQVIAGRGSTLPLRRWGSDGEPLDPGTFLRSPEPDVNRPLPRTLLDTLGDLCLHGRAYWRVLLRDYRDYPLAAQRMAPEYVAPKTTHVQGSGTVITGWVVDGIEMALGDVIEYVGPLHGGWLTVGARTIRNALALERAARRFAEEPLPLAVLRNTSGVDLPADKVQAILDGWKLGRQTRATAYVNAALDVVPMGFSARDTQLVEGRQQSVLEVSRLSGIPSGLLGAAPSGSSLTYRNLEGEAHQLYQSMLPYLSAIESRLSAEDITPRGQSVRFDLSAMLRPDTPTIVAMIAQLVPLVGPDGEPVLDVAEARALLGLSAARQAGLDVPAIPSTDPASLPTPGSGPVA
jgi:hypothetical protein